VEAAPLERDGEFFRRETDKMIAQVNGKLDVIEKQQAENEARTDEAFSRIDKKIDKILEATSSNTALLKEYGKTLDEHSRRIMESERERATLRSEVDTFKDHVKSDQSVETWVNGKVVAAVVAAAGIVGAALLNHYVSQAVTAQEPRIVYVEPSKYPEMYGHGRSK
jgi:vacuolar-type H+-ATPase subunit I/STV1